jgi:hypothetical protein
MKPTFALDIDGVLLDLHSVTAKVLGLDHLDPKEIVRHWDLSWTFGIPPSEVTQLWAEVFSQPAQPYAGALDFIASIRGLGYAPLGVSLRNTPVGLEAAARDFPQLGIDIITVSADKPLTLRSYEAHYFVEDSIQNALELIDSPCPSVKQVFLIDRPWNQSHDLAKAYKRVRSYEEILLGIGDARPFTGGKPLSGTEEKMDKNTDLILTARGSPTRWEDEDKSSYEVAVLQDEYQKRLYSSDGLELSERAEATPAKM